MDRQAKLILSLVFIVSFQSLLFPANPYKKYYTDLFTPNKEMASKICIFNDTGMPPQMFMGSNYEADYLNMLEEGFALIGFSSFEEDKVKDKDLVKFGTELRCHVILTYKQFARTIIENQTVFNYVPPKTATTNVSGTIRGTGGTAKYSGTGTTTTSGTYTTQQVPHSEDRYNFGAAFWVRRVPPVFGVFVTDLFPDERLRYQRNRGAVIRAISKGSPAYLADLMRGDLLLKIGDDEIINQSSLDYVDRHIGQSLCIEFIRDETIYRKKITLNRSDGSPGQSDGLLNCDEGIIGKIETKSVERQTQVEQTVPQQAQASISGTSKVTITSKPEGASIFINEVFMGTTPATMELPSGKHRVRLFLLGRADWKQEIQVDQNTSFAIYAEFK